MVAAGGSIKCILGLQESFEFAVTGLDKTSGTSARSATGGNLEIVSMDAFARKDGRGCQLVVLVSIAKVAKSDFEFDQDLATIVQNY